MHEHSRYIYTFLDLLGDLGGIHDIAIALIGIFVLPMSNFSYILKILEKLYLVKTDDESLMMKKSMQKKNGKSKFKTKNVQLPPEYQNTALAREIESHYPIKLDTCKFIKLFFL